MSGRIQDVHANLMFMVPPRDNAAGRPEQPVQVEASDREDAPPVYLGDPLDLSDEELARYGITREEILEARSDEGDDLTDEELAELERRVDDIKRGNFLTEEEFWAQIHGK